MIEKEANDGMTFQEVPERILDLAAGVIVLKSIRMFFNTPDSEPHGPGAEGLIENWKKVPFDDRVSALPEFQKQVWEAVLEGLQPIRKGAVWHG